MPKLKSCLKKKKGYNWTCSITWIKVSEILKIGFIFSLDHITFQIIIIKLYLNILF